MSNEYPVLYPEPSDSMVCPRPHVDEASVTELIAAIARNGTFDTEFGTMQVFRQYIPRNNTVEYTVFFLDEGDNKMRLDHEVTEEEIATMVDPEGQIRDMIFQRIRDGHAKKVEEL